MSFSEQINGFQIIGILDGHGGIEAAEFVKKNFMTEFSIEYKNNKNLSLVLINTFVKLNTQIINSNIVSGTTATIAIIDHNKLFIANVGDSRAILIRNDEIIPLTKDHKITDKEEFENYRNSRWYKEKSRLISQRKLKGFKMTTISRSIGDSFFEDALSAKPDVLDIKLKIGDKIIIATDGLWNYMDYLLIQQILKSPTLIKEIPSKFIKVALKNGSKDNITVAIISV